MTTVLTPRLYLREMADDDLDDMAALLGDCGLTVQRVDGADEIEIGYHVRADLQGKGLATEAAAACRDYARETLKIDRLIAIINPANAPSQRVAEKLGLHLEKRTASGDSGEHEQLIFAATR